MRRISLEKEIAKIINDENAIENRGIKIIKNGSFKCELPADYMNEILANARRISRNKQERYPVPKSQKVLAFLSNYKEVIPYVVEMVKKKRTSEWFRNQMFIHFPDKAKEINSNYYFGTRSDLRYALDTMPKAWEKYEILK